MCFPCSPICSLNHNTSSQVNTATALPFIFLYLLPESPSKDCIHQVRETVAWAAEALTRATQLQSLAIDFRLRSRKPERNNTLIVDGLQFRAKASSKRAEICVLDNAVQFLFEGFGPMKALEPLSQGGLKAVQELKLSGCISPEMVAELTKAWRGVSAKDGDQGPGVQGGQLTA